MWISQATSSSLKISTCYKCIEDGYSSNPHVCVLLTVASPCLCTAHCCKSMFVYCSLLQVLFSGATFRSSPHNSLLSLGWCRHSTPSSCEHFVEILGTRRTSRLGGVEGAFIH